MLHVHILGVPGRGHGLLGRGVGHSQHLIVHDSYLRLVKYCIAWVSKFWGEYLRVLRESLIMFARVY